MKSSLRLFLSFSLIIFISSAQAQDKFYVDRFLNLSNSIMIGLNSSVLVYHSVYGFATLGGSGNINSANLSGNSVDQGERQNTNPQIFPPRVVIGLLGIASGASSVYIARNSSGFNIENNRRLRNLGIAGISMGIAGIMLPPLIRMIPLARKQSSATPPSNVPPLQGSLNFGIIPSSGTAGLWLSF